MEFGTPEAMWHLWLDEFPAIVTMDAHGNSLHKDVETESGKQLELLPKRLRRCGMDCLFPRRLRSSRGRGPRIENNWQKRGE